MNGWQILELADALGFDDPGRTEPLKETIERSKKYLTAYLPPHLRDQTDIWLASEIDIKTALLKFNQMAGNP